MLAFCPHGWLSACILDNFSKFQSLIAYSEILMKKCDWIQLDLKIAEVNKDFLVCSLDYSEVSEIYDSLVSCGL